MLVNALETWAKSIGKTEVHLSTQSEMLAAIEFYKSIGYVLDKAVDVVVPDSIVE